METVTDFIFLAPKSLQMMSAAMKLKDTRSLEEKLWPKAMLLLKKQRHYFADKCPSSQSYDFSSSHVWMWKLDYKENWAPKNWCFWLWCWRRLLRVPWTARRSNQSFLRENSPEYSSEGLMLKLKLQIFGHLMGRTDLLEKTPMLGKIEGRRRRGQQRDEMVRWHHQLNGHEFEQAPGVGVGQGSLTCCSLWDSKESDTSEWLNWTDLSKERNNWIRYAYTIE